MLLSKYYIIIFFLYFASFNSLAENYTFNNALKKLGGAIDPSYFDKGAGQLPGVYVVDIYINESAIDNKQVKFELLNDKLSPCISDRLLEVYGVSIDKYKVEQSNCNAIQKIKDAGFLFDFNELKLYIYIPQIHLPTKKKHIQNRDEWDDGISAFYSNYNVGFNGYQYNNTKLNSEHFNFQNGLNVGSWRIRNYSSVNKVGEMKRKFESFYTYASRRLEKISSIFNVGELNTSSSVFNSVPVMGVQVFSDENMLSDTQKIYAPVFYGVARTNATVEIKQSGAVIYRRNISAGAFALDDVIPFTDDDFELYIYEADGLPKKILVPFSIIPGLLRKNTIKFDVVAGKYNGGDAGFSTGNELSQFSLFYGLTSNLTIYGGSQIANGYYSIVAGTGLNVGRLGALSVDVTDAHAGDLKSRGYRLRYSASTEATNTNFNFSANYNERIGFNKIVDFFDSKPYSGNVFLNRQPRSYYALNISQPGVFNDMLSVGVKYNESSSGIDEKKSYHLNYNFPLGRARVTFSIIRSRHDYNGVSKFNDNINLGFSTPFSLFGHGGRINYSRFQDMSKLPSHTFSVSGDAYDKKMNWSFSNTVNESPVRGNSSYIYSRYHNGNGEFYASYGFGDNRSSKGFGVSGGVLIHSEGFTFSQRISEPVALIDAKGGGEIKIANSYGSKTDSSGFGVLSFLQPYKRNTVSLDPSSLSDDVSLDLSNQSVVPTEGAIVKAKFSIKTGARILVKLKRTKEEGIPFGAIVSSIVDYQHMSTGIVGDGGLVYLTGMADSGALKVMWGKEDKMQCKAIYKLPALKPPSGLYEIEALCR
ncbi:fimbria/pilus outer membrane usher protein [Enterobacter kobei]|uniref:fimbria/pilus outer membrane usher protein n=1 Tax=Enterobacter kobei TaxID=208224 RepID=UPI003EDA9A82